MARGSCCLGAFLFCGVLAACGDAPSEHDLGLALTGGHQETPNTVGMGGVGGATASTASSAVEGGTGGAPASGGTSSPGGIIAAGGTVGAGGSIVAGGTVGAGGIIATDGAVGAGGIIATDGAVGAGGIIATDGAVGAGGIIATGGTEDQGGRAGSGGAGGTGSAPAQGGTTGSTTTTPVDLTCNTDDDCCVSVDTCRAIAVLYSKIQGLVYWPPATSTSCLRCYTPTVEVSCRNNQCTGTVLGNYLSQGTAHCGKIQSAGTGGTTTQANAASVAIPQTPVSDSAPQLVFGC
jgi:hypothetical protein